MGVRDSGDRVWLHFSPDLDMNWLIKSGELFELSLPHEVRYEEEERLTLQDCWADQMYLICTVCLQRCLEHGNYHMRFP